MKNKNNGTFPVNMLQEPETKILRSQAIIDGRIAQAVRKYPFPWTAKPVEPVKGFGGHGSKFALYKGKEIIIFCEGNTLAEAQASEVRIRQCYEQSLEE